MIARDYPVQMSDASPCPGVISLGDGDNSAKNVLLLILLTVLAFLVMGYHPGLEDDAFYLAAIKRNLNPALFTYDSEFFRLQFQATIFDKLIASSVRLSHLPLAWAILLWQFAAIFLLLHGCWRISRRCYAEATAQWAAVTTVGVLLTLPVPGVAISLADQYLHPRTLATAAILAAIVAVMDRRPWLAGVLLAIAFTIHAIMASFGISFCTFLLWNQRAAKAKLQAAILAAALLVPLGWMFAPASDAWRQAAATRGFYFLSQWHWYEWLGVFAPLGLIFGFRCVLRYRRDRSDGPALRPFISSLFQYGVFHTIVGILVMLPPSLERLRPFEPMRYLYLLHLFFFLIVGGLVGRYVLGRHLYRWLFLFLPLSGVMFYAQRQLYPASVHLELPGVALRNPWLEAFAWIRQNTRVDSLFAVNPHYMTLPGEDYHGFRPLAERSVLADYDKDGGMAARVPPLAPRWLREVTALNGWQNFRANDFQRLQHDFGLNWVVLSRTDAIVSNPGGVTSSSAAVFNGKISDGVSRNDKNDPAGMTCPYKNQQLLVCRLY